MQRLTFPPTGAVRDFSDRRAAVKRRNGWVDPPGARKTRAELDEQAAALGLDPGDYRTKQDVADAIAEHTP